MKIGFIDNTFYRKWFSDYRNKNPLVIPYKVKNYNTLSMLLKLGEIDGFIGDSIDGWINEDFSVLVNITENGSPLVYLFPDDSQLEPSFNKVLKYFIKSPVFYSLLKRYFGNDFPEIF